MPILDDDGLRAALSAGEVNALTIDTNIFDEKQLHLNSVTLRSLARLSGHGFRFMLADTVAREVIGHLDDAASQALRSAKKAIGQALHVFETKDPTRDQLLDKITKGRNPTQAAQEQFSVYVKDTGCEILNDRELVDTATLFEDYFAKRAPFGAGKKKTEFPDALALNALERTATDHDIGILVVSKDGDWSAFCKNSERLYLVPNIERALALVANAPPILRRSVFDWLEGEVDGTSDLMSHLTSKVEVIEFDANATPSMGGCELYAWAGELESVALPLEDEIDIIEVEPRENGEELGLVVSLPLVLIVKIPVEVNFSFWDGVDKESIPMGGRTIEVREDIDTEVIIVIDVQGQGTGREDITLVDVEVSTKDYYIDLGEIDVFEPEDYCPYDEEPLVE